VVVVRDQDGSLCGLAPLYFQSYSFIGALPCRILRVMADRLTGAEYPDWIVRTDCEREAMQAIIGELVANRGHWDCLWMPQVSGWSGAYERISKACLPLGFYVNQRITEFSQIDLPDSIAAYERLLSDSRRRKIRWQRSKILRQANVSMSCCTSPGELPRYLDALFELHNARRQVLGEEGAFSSRPEEAQFYREFAPRALEEGWLSLCALHEGASFKAVQLGYVYGNTYLALQEGFDPTFIAGAGNVLRLEVIRQCIAAGIRYYDFLGGYTLHKRRWGAQPRNGYDLFIGRAGFTNRVIFFGKVWPSGRYLRPVTRALKPAPVRWLAE
jgi:hypothetical protein